MDGRRASKLHSALPWAIFWSALLATVLSVAVVLFWVLVLEAAELWLITGLCLARVAVSSVCLYRFTRPIGAYFELATSRGAVEDGVVLAAHEAFQTMTPRYFLVIEIGWSSVGLLAVMAGALGWGPAIGGVELLAVALTMAATCLGQPLFDFSVLFGLTRTLRHAVGTELRSRGLEPPRRRSDQARELTGLVVFLFFGAMCSGCAAGVSLWAKLQRAELAGELLSRARVAAVQPEASSAQTRIVSSDQLPQPAQPLESGQVLEGFDSERGQVWVAVALDEERWVLAAQELDEHTFALGLFMFVFLGSLFFPVAKLGNFAAQFMVDPVRELDQVAREVIERGRLAQVERIVPLRGDDLGALTTTFNRLLDTFEELARAAQAVGEGELEVDFEAEGDLGDAFRAMLAHLNAVVARMEETTIELVSVAAELLAATESQDALVRQQVAHTEAMSAATAELASSAAQINEAADLVLDNAERSADTTSTALARIHELDEQARGIAMLLELIHEIAERSDLLALNGSLEAVRAGEAGRGFALVAAEMRRLAERVGGAVLDIRAHVGNIERSAEVTVDATEQGRALVEHTAGIAWDINRAIAEQTRRTQEVASSSQEVAHSVSSVQAALQQTRATAEGLRHHAGALEAITRQFRRASDAPGSANVGD